MSVDRMHQLINTQFKKRHAAIYAKFAFQEEFEDTKGVIRIRKSKKNRQHNDQKKKYIRTSNNLQIIHIKLQME